MDTPTSPSAREPLPFGRMARAALILTVGLAGAALAAPCIHDDCRNASRALASPQVPWTALTVRSVDLGDADAAEDPAVGLSESAAPLLYLTPRVASILEEVFDETVPTEDAVEGAAAEAPVAEAAPPAEDPESYGPLSQADTAFHLPKFQRQMYRTDI